MRSITDGWSLLRLEYEAPKGSGEKIFVAKLNARVFFAYCMLATCIVGLPFVLTAAHPSLPLTLRNVPVSCELNVNLTGSLLVLSIVITFLLLRLKSPGWKSRNGKGWIDRAPSASRASLFGHRPGIFEVKDLIAYGRLLDVSKAVGAVLAGTMGLLLVVPAFNDYRGPPTMERQAPTIRQAGECQETLVNAQKLIGQAVYRERSFRLDALCPLTTSHIEFVSKAIAIPEPPKRCSTDGSKLWMTIAGALLPFIVLIASALVFTLVCLLGAVNRINRSRDANKSPAQSDMNRWMLRHLEPAGLKRATKIILEKLSTERAQQWPFVTTADVIRWGIVSLTLFPDPQSIRRSEHNGWIVSDLKDPTASGFAKEEGGNGERIPNETADTLRGLLTHFQWPFVLIALSPIVVPLVSLLATAFVLWHFPGEVFGLNSIMFTPAVHKPMMCFAILVWSVWSNYHFIRVSESLAMMRELAGLKPTLAPNPQGGNWVLEPVQRAFWSKMGHVPRVPVELEKTLVNAPYRAHILRSIEAVIGENCRKQLILISTVISAVFLGIIGAF